MPDLPSSPVNVLPLPSAVRDGNSHPLLLGRRGWRQHARRRVPPPLDVPERLVARLDGDGDGVRHAHGDKLLALDVDLPDVPLAVAAAVARVAAAAAAAAARGLAALAALDARLHVDGDDLNWRGLRRQDDGGRRRRRRRERDDGWRRRRKRLDDGGRGRGRAGPDDDRGRGRLAGGDEGRLLCADGDGAVGGGFEVEALLCAVVGVVAVVVVVLVVFS